MRLVHVRAGSLSADPLDVARHNDMNQGGEQSRIRVAARHAPHSRAARDASPTLQRNQLSLAARGIAPVHRAAPAFRLARSHRVRDRAVGAPGVGGESPGGGPGHCAAAAARPLTQKGRRLTGA